MAKKGPDPPTPPDPTVVANAQSAANIASADNQQKLNMLGSSGPNGTVSWVADASQPGGYRQVTTLSPGEQQLNTASVQAQNAAINTANQQIGRVNTALATPFNYNGLPSLAGSLTPGQTQSSVGQTPATQTSFANTSVQPGIGTTGQQTSFQGSGPLQSGSANPQAAYFAQQAGPIQNSVGGADINQSVTNAGNAVYQQAASRLDPQWQQAQSQEAAMLANQGLSQNSAAYQNAMDTFNRGKNDAYNQANFSAIQAGNQEQNTLFGQQLNQGQFANAAQGQQFGQNQQQLGAYNAAAAQNSAQGLAQANLNNSAQGQQFAQNQAQGQFTNNALQNQFAQGQAQGQFANQASAQQYAQNQGQAQFQNQAVDQIYQQALASGQFANSAEAQQFAQQQAAATFQNQARTQGAQERAYAQNLPLNQFNSLISSGQVQSPSNPVYTPTSVAPTDVTGAYALNAQTAAANYQAQMQQQNSLLGGLFNLGSAGIGLL